MNTIALRGERVGDELSRIVLDQADRLLRGEVTKQRMAEADGGEFSATIWQAVENAGLPLALVSEAHGGAGLAPADAFRIIRLAGYHTLPVPLAESILATALWDRAGGELTESLWSLAPVCVDDAIAIEPSAGGFILRGRARRIPWAAQVRHILVYARDARGAGYLASLPRPTTQVQALRNLANEPRDTLAVEAVELSAQAVRPAPVICAEGFLVLGALMRALQMVGAMERCLDYALAYAMERRQFGRPIGKFQAVQHMLAEAAGHYSAAAAAAELAAQAYDAVDLPFAVAIAKARVGEAAGKVAEICHQVHGAIGFTQEHPLHFATRRLWSWRDEFGHEPYWQERIGHLVCRAGGEALWPMLVGADENPARSTARP